MAWRDALADAARLLQERSRRTLPFEPAWRALQAPGQERPAVAAVDGSHAVLVDNGDVWVVATRAAATHWPGRHAEMPVTVTASVPGEAQSMVDGLYTGHGLEAPAVRSSETFAEAVRAIQEHDAAAGALHQMPKGGLLLIDGALERLPRHAAPLAERLLERAHAAGIALAGVAKRSRLDAEGVPLVSALRRASGDAMPGVPWAVPVPGHSMAHVALLHGKAQHAFRVDVTEAETLDDLLPLSRDAVYLGYPYPLAAAHNAVAISQATARQWRDRLGDEVRRHGGDAFALMADFHDILDRNAPRS